MKDKEARQQIKGMQSRMDKNKGVLAQEVKRIESKGDKSKDDLLGKVAELEREQEADHKDLYRRLIRLEDAVYSKFVKREFWEERKETTTPDKGK